MSEGHVKLSNWRSSVHLPKCDIVSEARSNKNNIYFNLNQNKLKSDVSFLPFDKRAEHVMLVTRIAPTRLCGCSETLNMQVKQLLHMYQSAENRNFILQEYIWLFMLFNRQTISIQIDNVGLKSQRNE